MQRQIATADGSTSTTKNPQFANKIIQLAINRTAKNTNSPENQINTLLEGDSNQIEKAKPLLSKEEVEKGKQDIAAVNNDLQLLSSLLGRPISANDLPNLTNQFGDAPPQRKIPTSTTTTTTARPAILQEVELLQNLLQANKLNEESTVEVPVDAYGKTNDALLATLLKQQGIGPAHNNVPVQQLISANLYPTTTQRSRPTAPVRTARPILDGLSWLWRTWQDTAPGQQQGGTAPATAADSSRTKTRASAFIAPPPSANSYGNTGNGAVSIDEGLDSDTAAVSSIN